MQYIGRVDRALLREQALGVLRQAIVGGELPPGEPIKDVELADSLGLSRTPVREALARLTDEGLVETKPHSYTRVTQLDTKTVRDAHVVVQTMHGLATRLAVPHLTVADLDGMVAANVWFADALATGSTREALEADDAFHDVLVQACGNQAVAATIQRYTPMVHRLERLRFSSAPGRDSVRMHEEIVDACRAGDAERAGRLAEDNWATLAAWLRRSDLEEQS